MDGIKNGFAKVMAKWVALSNLHKIGFVGSVLIVAIVSGVFFFVGTQKKQQYLFTDLSKEDSAAISTFLKTKNYDGFLIDSKGVKVNVEDVDQLRLQLSQEGLPYKGNVGWEKFDEKDFTRTDFEQEINKLRAIQGELSRTISSVDGINSARVHIVVPKSSLFVRDKKKPSASIYLQTKRGFELERKQIRGIQHLVSRAVEGLDTGEIVILDSQGQMLTDVESKDRSAKQSRELLNYKSQIEKTLEERIRAIVGRVVGPDRIEAKVDAQVDFTEEKQTISDVNPDDVVVVSKNTSGFSMQGSGLNPTGIPGSKSNVPGEEQGTKAASHSTGSKKDNELVNYDFSKVVSEKTLAVGNVKRLTVSVIVDGKQAYPLDGTTPEFSPRTEEEMTKIKELIRNAVGFKKGRDSLTVHNMMFQLDPFQVLAIKKQKQEDREYVSTLAVSGVTALSIILFFAFIVRPYFRWLSYDPEKKEEQAIIEEFKPDLEHGSMQNVQVQEDVPFEKMTPKEQVLYLAKNEPKRTTEALRILLNPTSG